MKTDKSSTRFSIVTHGFWKYPIVGLIVILFVVIVGFSVGSPFYPTDTIKSTAVKQPGGTIWAVAQELDGTSASQVNKHEYGMKDPAKTLVLKPIQSASWFLSSQQKQALKTYEAASPAQQKTWAANYDTAIQKTIASKGNSGDGGPTPVPTLSKISSLKGNFGPVPILANAVLKLAQKGYLQTYFQGTSPNHVYQYTNIWLYDEPMMLNTAMKQGLTDDQWGMVKERGFFVGPWYLIVPAIAHVKLPAGSTGPGFILWNGVIALFFVVIFPLVPGLRSIPKYLGLYKLIYAVDPNKKKESQDVHGTEVH